MIRRKLNRILLIVLTLVIALDLLSISVEAKNKTTTEYGIYVILTRSNLRSKPAKDGQWLATLPEGDYVIMLDKPDKEFCHVSYNGTEGYVYRGCISKAEGEKLKEAKAKLGISEDVSEKAENTQIPSTVLEYMDEQRPNSALVKTSSENIAQDNEKLDNPSTEDDKNSDDKDVDDKDVDEQAGNMDDKAVTEATEEDRDKIADDKDSPTVVDIVGSMNPSTSMIVSKKKEDENEVTYEEAKIRVNAVLRKLPSADSSKLLTVPASSSVVILDEGDNGYLHIIYDKNEGYVFAKTVIRDGSVSRDSGILDTIVTQQSSASALSTRHKSLTSSASTVISAIVQTEVDVTVENEELVAQSSVADANTLKNSDIDYQIRTRANMRLTPSKSGTLLTKVPTGANVTVLGDTQNGYTLVQYNGIEGYVLESVVVDSVDFAKMSAEQSALFTLTGYCTCAKCCGNFSPEVTGLTAHTATGTIPTQGRTIAVDPKIISYGSVVHIDGLGDYVAEDCGGKVKGNHIDVYFESHEEALAFGRQKRYVSVN